MKKSSTRHGETRAQYFLSGTVFHPAGLSQHPSPLPAERGDSRQSPMEPRLKVNSDVTAAAAGPTATALLRITTVHAFQVLAQASRASRQAHASPGSGCPCAVRTPPGSTSYPLLASQGRICTKTSPWGDAGAGLWVGKVETQDPALSGPLGAQRSSWKTKLLLLDVRHPGFSSGAHLAGGQGGVPRWIVDGLSVSPTEDSA
ncbi:uncharacterized protein LOC125920686 [Panthera uncia]|uniref:uncharacterized protein LOC125920686 n=1 Tax=Panthera uncia TaxID=29064 RepID=UPI0020FFCE17|nr:uncharacterized protein LOC125920686 [Panthera uncia]